MTVEKYTLSHLAWKHIMRNVQVRQDGLCRHCRKEITLNDCVVCRRSSKPAYYHFECAEILNIV